MDANPTARIENLIIEELGDGVVVYDGVTQRAHSLNAQAAMIWREADGSRTVADLAGNAGLEEAAVLAILDQLHAQGLLLDQVSVSRRQMLRRSATIGAAAVGAAPLIETVVIPTAAAHASTRPPEEHRIFLGTITPDNMSGVVTIPLGLDLPGRFLIRRDTSKVFAPITYGIFEVTVAERTITFTNVLPNGGSEPPYHYVLKGTDGLGHAVYVLVPGTFKASVPIPYGPKLDIGITYVWVS